ncbi:MAG: 3-isopropylmalate dehydrogenase [Planctomycetes bacterium]|nr:3-isopropylmalate dehydrogenase [Planctomycetota bacterium]
MSTHRIAVLPGDGIGVDVTAEALKVLRRIEKKFGHSFRLEEYAVGGALIDRKGVPIDAETLHGCKKADAILYGAVGGPRWDSRPLGQTPLSAILTMRKELDCFANLRPVKLYPALAEASPLKRRIVDRGVDILIIRELTGGLYYSRGRGRDGEGPARRAYDTMEYSLREIERVVRFGFQAALGRRRRLTSIDKENVLETSKFWRETVEAVAPQFPEVRVSHLLVDAAAMRLITDPDTFDVIVTENTFGDILSDEAAVLAGSIGMLPSASLGEGCPGLYEPIHGSAPDIAGKGIANPIAAILTVAMMLQHSFGMPSEARAIEQAVEAVLTRGGRTRDIASGQPGEKMLTTVEMGEAIAGEI